MSLNVQPYILRDFDIDSMLDEIANHSEKQLLTGSNELLHMADQLRRRASLLQSYALAKFGGVGFEPDEDQPF